MDSKGSDLESWLLSGWILNMMALLEYGLDEGIIGPGDRP